MQISSRSKSVRVGVISLWALMFFLIIFIVAIVGKNQKLFTSKFSLYSFVPNAQGLNPGAFITLSGLKVGVVGEMKFTKKYEQQGIVIELKISREYKKMITTSSKATINTMGMLGDKYVDISLGDLSDPALKEGEFIAMTPPLDLGSIASNATAAISDLQTALNNINKITQQALDGKGMLGLLINDQSAQNNLAQLLSNLDQISTQIKQGKGSLGQFVQDTTLYATFKNATTSLEKIVAKIQRGEGSLGKLVSDTTLFTRLNSISVSADSLFNRLQEGEGTAGKLMEDEQLYEQLLMLTKSLIALTEDIKKNPKKYVTIEVF